MGSAMRRCDDQPRGIGITDDEIDESLVDAREALRKIEQDIGFLESLRDLSMKERREIYELVRSMRDMKRLQRQRSLC
jgi:hypothetical protein